LIGSHLEKAGWRQGSIVKPENIQALLEAAGHAYEPNVILLLASQSCDVANNDIESDPYIELSIAKPIAAEEGHLTHNKNPRILHTSISCRTGDENVATVTHLEIKAFEKLFIPKECLKDLQPEQDKKLEQQQQRSYVAWLAARYSRPALPTAFNNRIKDADPRGKLRKKAKQGSLCLTGIYIEITPDAEIGEGESYSVNLMGLLPADFKGDTTKAEGVINAYAEVMRTAGMDVTAVIRKEDEVSVATIKRFKRFYLDDLSFRDNAPLPPDIQVNL
jgi:hypothetical protein